MNKRTSRHVAAKLLLYFGCPVLTVSAADVYWNGSEDSIFNTAGNWSIDIGQALPFGAVPGITDVAIFNANSPIDFQIESLGGAQSVAGLVFNANASGDITILDPTSTLTIGSSGITLDAGTGEHTIFAPITTGVSQTWTNNSGHAFASAGGLNLVGQTLTLAGPGGFTFAGTTLIKDANRVVSVTSTGQVTFGAINTSDGSIARLIIFDIAAGSEVEAFGVISGIGAVRKDGAGTLNLTAANSFTSTGSGLFISDGRVNVTIGNTASPKLNLGSVAGGTPVLDIASGVNYRVSNIDYQETGNPNGAVIQGDGTLSLDGNRVFDVGDSSNADADLTINVSVRNQAGGGGSARSLTKTGAGTLVFNGVNDFSGTFAINGGRVIQNASQTLAAALSFGGTSNLTIGDGVAFLLAGTITVNEAGSGTLIDGPGGIRLAATSAVQRIFNVADGAAADDLTVNVSLLTGTALQGVQKMGLGRLVLQGEADYAGVTEVDQGELVLDYSLHNGSKLSETANLQFRGGALTVNGNSTATTQEDLGTGQLRVVSGSSVLSLVSNGGQTVTLDVNAITRNVGEGLIDFRTNDVALATFQTTEANSASGILGAYATFNGDRFAANDGSGKIVAAAGVIQNDRSLWQNDDAIIVDGALTGTLGASRLDSLIFDGPVANTLTLDNAYGSLTLTTGGILVSADVGANNTTITGGQILVPATPGGSLGLILTNYSTGTLEIAANLGGNNSPLGTSEELTIGGTGEVLLSGRNLLSGDTNIQGTVRVSGGNAIGDFRGVVMASGGSGVVLNLDGGTEAIGNLSGGAAASQTDAHVDLGTGGTLILNQTATSTYLGDLDGSGVVIKKGSSTFISTTQALTFTGELQILGGSFELDGSNNSGLAGDPTIRIRGGQITGEQYQGGSLDKFGDGVLILEGTNDSGVRLISNQTTSTTGSRTDTMRQLNLNSGANTITIINASNTNAVVPILAFNDATTAFTRAPGATLLVRGDNLGQIVSVDSSRVTFTNSITDYLIGGGGTTTDISILPFAISENTNSAGAGNTFLTVGTNGLRQLDIATEYQTSYTTALANGDDNLSVSASLGALASGTLNSLRIDTSAGDVTLAGAGGGGNTLTLTSGALLVTAGTTANDATLSGFDQIRAGSAAAGDDELVIHVTSTNAAASDARFTIGSSIADQTAGGGITSLTKSGGGTLVLTGVNSYSGTTTINQGVLEFSALSNLGTGSTIRNSGGTLRWAAGNTTDISARTVDLIGPSVYLTPASTSTGTGGNILDAGAVFDVGANDVTLANPIGNGGVGSLTKIGSGTLTLSASPTYTGATMVTEGALNFQTIAANTTSALYILSNTGEVSSTVANGLNVNQLIVGGVYSGTTSGTGRLTVEGGAVNVGHGNGDDFMLIGWRDGSAGTAPSGTHLLGVADFTNASSVNIDVAQIALGQFVSGVAGNQSTARGDLLLPSASSAVNTITANLITVGNAPGGVFNNLDGSLLHLGGGTTAMNVDTLVIGGRKSTGSLTIDPGGVFRLRGTQGGDTAANLFIGENDNAQGSTATPSMGTVDFTGAEVDLNLNYLNIGRISYTTAGGTGSGTLTFDTGVIQARTVRLADPNYAPGSGPNVGNSAATNGTIFQNGGEFRFEELSHGAGTAGYFWSGGTIRNVANRDLVNQNVAVNMDTLEDRSFVVDAGRTATFTSNASFTGGGGFTKEGAGTLLLAGANDYTGDTIVNGGRFLVNGSISGSIVYVNDSGTVGGTGTIATPVMVNSGGTMAPGETIGILGTGDFSLASNAVLKLELGGLSAGNTAASHDQLVVSGSVTLGGDAEITLSLAGGYNPTVGDVFYVILNNGTADATQGIFANAPDGIITGIDGAQYQVSYNAEFGTGFENAGNDVALKILAVPEPSSLYSLAAGFGLLLGLQRFRRPKTA